MNALAGEDIVLKSKGLQYFSYTYVADAVSALLFVMMNGNSGEPYNISVDACNVSLYEFAQMCADAVGKKVVFDLPTGTELRGFSIATQAIMDNTKLRQIGWSPKYTMKDVVERIIEILK